MSYDEKCYTLAEEFLSDEPQLTGDVYKHELAQIIQTAIEEAIALWNDALVAGKTPEGRT